MPESSQKHNNIWLHAMNFIIVVNVWGYHVPAVFLADDVMCKWDVY